jgi:hypothetical protein
MLDKLIYPVLLIITGCGYVIAFLVKAMLSLHKPMEIFSLWFRMRILWKLNSIHIKIKNRKHKCK